MAKKRKMPNASRVTQKETRRALLRYMGDRCEKCRRTVQESEFQFLTYKGQFDFNHVDPRKKSPDYERLIRLALCDEVLDELDKCVLLCRRCHGILHAQSIAGDLTLDQEIGDRTFTAAGVFQGILERESDKALRLWICADPELNLSVFQVTQDGASGLMSVGELRGKINALIEATRDGYSLQIRDQRRRMVFHARRLGDRNVRMHWRSEFPLIKATLKTFDGEVLYSRPRGTIDGSGDVFKRYRFRATGLYRCA